MTDPRDVLALAPMTRVQVLAVLVTVGLNALDGFDVLAISFASPEIARAWGIDRAVLGVVLSMELIGMGVGSVLLGALADKIGRRRPLLGSLVMMMIGMAMAAQAHGVIGLCWARVVTGIGVGGTLAAINAVVAEFANARRRSFCVSVMAIGYPLGAVCGGLVASALLASGDWRAVFWFGGGVTALSIPFVLLFIPESVAWLCARQPPGALFRINETLARMRLAPLSRLPRKEGPDLRRPFVDIFSRGQWRLTVLLALAFCLHVTTYYFIVKWVPKIVVDMGFTAAAAGGVLVWISVGGASGAATVGLASLRFGLRPLTIAVLLMSTVTVAVFGRAPADISRISLICATVGFFTNAGTVGMYGLLAQSFPTDLRATGSGFALGAGRAGAILAPILAGLLFRAGCSLELVATSMGLGSAMAAAALCFVPSRPIPIFSNEKEHVALT